MTEQIAAESEFIPIDDPGLSIEELVDRLHENANFFVKGEKNILDWNTKKEHVIIQMGKDIAVLMQRGHYPDHKDPHDISSMVCDLLKDHQFVDDNAFRWVRKILAPLGWTRPYSVVYDIEENKSRKLFTYLSKEDFEKLPVEDQINYRKKVLAIDTERKRQIRLAKDNMAQVFSKQGVDPDIYSPKKNPFDPEYTENCEDDEIVIEPPEERKQNHLFADRARSIARKYLRVAKIWDGIADNIDLYPPQTPEMDKRLEDKAALIDDYLVEMQIHFFSGYNDDKAVATWDEWCDYLEEKALHGNNAAASKFATPTGEFVEMKRKDGSTFLQALERRVTNEHLKKKMPEQVKELKKSWIFEFLFSALRDWFHNQYYILGEEVPEKINEIEKAYLAKKRQDI